MTTLQMSARFAAYTWYLNQPENAAAMPADAHDFARRSWEQFLPNASEGMGRLLKKLVRGRNRRNAKRRLAVAA